MEQWRAAAGALAEVRERELARLTPEAALAATNALLSLERPALPPARECSSGLIELQRLLRRPRSPGESAVCGGARPPELLSIGTASSSAPDRPCSLHPRRISSP